LARVFAVAASFEAVLPFAGGRVFGAETVAGDRYDVRVVDQSVEHGRCEDGIGEHFAPQLERLVAGQDDRAAFVPLGNDAEDMVGDDLVERSVGVGIIRTQFGRVKTDPPIGQVWWPAQRSLATWPVGGNSRP
jgi:hypothetical protein